MECFAEVVEGEGCALSGRDLLLGGFAAKAVESGGDARILEGGEVPALLGDGREAGGDLEDRGERLNLAQVNEVAVDGGWIAGIA
jgi:hypothetical protein